MIKQTDLKRYLDLKEEVKTLEKILKEGVEAGEKIQQGELTVSMDSRLTTNTSWKEVALDAARTFRIAKMDEPLRIIGLSFDKFSQPHKACYL